MKKKIISLAVALLLAVTMLPLTGLAGTVNVSDTDVAYAVQGGSIYFDKSTGTVTGANESITSATIPTKIDGKTVTAIGELAFANCSNLTSVVIPNSVTSIGDSAFFLCQGLTSVVIPDSVTSMGDWTFQNCYNLGSVTLSKNLTEIGYRAFLECQSLTSVTIPDGVTYIDNSAFANCYNLTSAVIPGSVTGIHSSAFNSSGLADVYYGGTQAEWDALTANNPRLTNVTVHFTAPAPQAVTIASLTYADGAVTVDWDAVPAADGYKLYRKVSGGSWTVIKNTAVATKYTDTGVAEGKTYYYMVRSHIGGVLSTGWSATVKSIAIPVTPKPVTITGLRYADGKVSVNWSAVSGVDGYRVFRKTDGGSWARINNNTTATTLTDPNVTPGTKYYYVVRSQVGGVYNTGWAATAQSITIPNAQPAPVTIASLTYADGAVTVDWDAVPGADGYRVYRKVPGGSWTAIKNTSVVTKYTDTNVEEGKTYYYVVRSQVGGVYNTGWSATAKSISIPVTPKPVTITRLTSSNGRVSISWSAVAGVDGYRVYRKVSGGSWARINNNTTATTLTDPNVTPGTKYYYVVRSQVGGVYNDGWTATIKSITVN